MPSFMDAFGRAFGRANAGGDTLKASKSGALITLSSVGRPVWSPRDYSAFAREGFLQNTVVYRCVRMISEAAASVPLGLSSGDVVLDEHPLLSLISKPNELQCSPDFFEAWYGFLLIAGNSYIEAVSVGGDVRELHVLRPDRMKVVPGGDGWPQAFEYSVNGRSTYFDQTGYEGGAGSAVRPILHQSFFHPLNDHYGASPLEAAGVAIDLHNAASGWNKALLDNSARPSGALVYNSKDGHLTGDQYERLKQQLEDNYQGAGNAGRPLLLEGGLDWKSMGFSPKDMDFIEAKYVAAREIALALGVPPMLLGIPGDNTYSNYQEANRNFWRQTVLPLVGKTCKALTGWLGPQFDEALELAPVLDRIDGLASEREALWKRVGDADFLTINEKRNAVGLAAISEGDRLAGRVSLDEDDQVSRD